MTAKSLTAAELISLPSNAANRIAVSPIYDWFNRAVTKAVGTPQGGDEDLNGDVKQQFMVKLYERVVVKAKEFKPQTRFNTETKKGGFPIMDPGKTEVCFRIISGKDVVTDIDANNVTYPMVQALISIYLQLNDMEGMVIRAPLGCTVGCKIKEFNDKNWGIHGHGGLHFVGSFVRDKRQTVKEVKEKLPSLVILMGFALGIDETRGMNVVDKVDTVASLIRATGTVNHNWPEINPAEWVRLQTGSAAINAAKIMVKKYKNMFNLEGDGGTSGGTSQSTVFD